MSWNYRLVHRRHDVPSGTAEDVYAIHEVYYDAAGQPEMVTEDPVEVSGETAQEAREAYRQMGEAFDRPKIEYDDF